MNERRASSDAGFDMPKSFEPERVEKRWRDAWLEQEVHVADASSSATPYSMVIPPPNVTGELHMGHALDQTLQDIVARWKRMAGYDVLWLPGTDHAGIATQNVVEKALAKEGTDRETTGREAFEARVWKWKAEYGDRILEQMRRLGLSCDWSRFRFTLDEGMSRAVRRAFVELFNEGAIYRGEYIVNWCPRCGTAISDLEVKHREVNGKLWRLRYPIAAQNPADGRPIDAAGPVRWLEVDTTRPETMLGDTALAVHPDDERYRDIVGTTAVLPVIGRELPVIADSFVDPEFGTGVVKVTPAHDPNDYEAGRRNELPSVRVIGRDGRMTEATGPYAGMDRDEARARLLERLAADGVLLGEREHIHAVGHCDRCDAVVEPQVSTQWFVRIKPLADRALAAVEDGRIRFHPESQVKVYREWMTNIRDWCISRQLWWGHQIPAWYCDACGELTVAEEAPQSCGCESAELRQDPDVLDTWFSSGLFPFSTLGWPDETDDLERYYPGQLLVTGYDILFFWVTRMIMLGLRFRDEVPFTDVFLHGLVRDEQGRKMSKSLGNGVNPLELVDRYGTDATRFTLASMCTPGSDMVLSSERMTGYRAFANKLWNATRFALMNLTGGDGQEGLQASADAADPRPLLLPDRWVLSRTAAMVGEVERHLERFRFDEACAALYSFAWHEFCDWYLEMSKVVLVGDDAEAQRATRGCLLASLEVLLRALHPIMPFLTEELWSRLPGDRGLLALAPWAAADDGWPDPEAEEAVALLQDLATEIRRLRADLGVDPRTKTPVKLVVEEEARRLQVESVAPLLASLVRAEPLEVLAVLDDTSGMASGVSGDTQVYLSLAGAIDLDQERARAERALARVGSERAELEARLANPGFVSNAPEAVVEKARARLVELFSEHEQLHERLRSLER